MTAAPATLPAGWSVRPPSAADVPVLLELTQASDVAAVGEPDVTESEIRDALSSPNTDPADDVLLAQDPGGAVLGWAYLENPDGGSRDRVEVYVWPGRGEAALAPLLDRALRRAAARGARFGHDRYTVRAGAVPTEHAWIAVLRAAGFEFVKRHARMRRPLDGVGPVPPPPPPGVTIHPLAGADDAQLRGFHAVLATAFRDSDHRIAGYDAWRTALSGAELSEWFVAHADGATVGALQSGAADAPEEGWVRLLGVLPAHRRTGVGAALLRHAFAAYARRGCTYAGLGVDLTNPTGAAGLYRSLGMTPLYEADVYQRDVTPG